MTKYKVVMQYSDGTTEEYDDLYDTEEDAKEAGDENCSCYHQGGVILNMSNPGDYPLDEDDWIDYEIIEVEV